MKTKLLFSALLALAVGAPQVHAAKVRVVTTLTDLADLTRNVGGESVEVHSLATGVEDTHGVPMKPSFVPLLNRADLVVLVGFDCEHAFLPALLEASRNPRIQPGHAGYVDCSKGITPVDVPKSTDHSEGDVHPYGNPHYLLDPVLAKSAVKTICAALAAAAPDHQADFEKNRDAYLAKLDAKIAEWQNQLAPFKGTKFVSYHEHWPYFADRFGLVYFGTIELKPGIDPTPKHIEEMVSAMKAEHVPIVVREPQFPEKVPALIARQTGATLLTLPIMPGGVPHTDTYMAEMDYIVNSFVNALKK
ncbi:MAG TPA: metal ABC transporter substrate-binding protein [Candidatus Acidoferrum sp.]|nr:metal ABC transporter substrate-binding protein [Candidatus Acidoferrum sp.]